MNSSTTAARSLIALALLLAGLIVTTGGLAAQGAKGPAPAKPAPAKADKNGNKLFEDVEARLAELPAGETVDVLVALSASASAARVADTSKRVGGFTTTRRFGIVDAFAATVTKGQAEALTHVPWVEHVELNSSVHAWNDTPRSSFGVTKARVDAPGLDGDADGNPSIYSAGDLVAAVIDTGIHSGHLDLDGGKVIAFKDFVNGRAAPYDDNGHGTHVAATIAGDGDARADRLYRGVAPGAGLVGVKVLDASGNGNLDAIVAAIDWVVANKDVYGIEAVNLSLGSSGCSNGTDVTSEAVSRAVAAGIVAAVAAGNEGPGTCTVGAPGAAGQALTVGAMSDLGTGGFALASFSSRGKTADGRIKPDVVAPGVDVTSAQTNTAAGYVAYSGTSMATPFVAGVALLMREATPSLTPQQVKDLVMSTAQDWGPTGADGEFGAGRLDAYAALRAAGASLTSGPDVPAHLYRSGTLSGTGATASYALNVTDLRFPIAATLTLSSLAAARSYSPDFDLYLYNPAGSLVALSERIDRQEDVTFKPTQTGTYTLRVRSYSGGGAFFVDVSHGQATVVVTAPGAPVLGAATAGDRTIGLTWTAPASNGGSAITGYRVYRGTAGGGETLLATVGAATSYTDATAVNGTTYSYQVSAVNSVGEGARSNERTATPVGPTAPGAPALTAATAGNSSVSLAWSAPASNGGAAISGYRVYRGAPGGAVTLLATVGLATTYTDTTAVNGTTYSYEVAAVNSAGEGAHSNALSATPVAPADITAPARPGTIRAASVGTHQVALDWSASTDNVGVTAYEVIRNGAVVATVHASQYLDAGLVAGGSYTYSVRAVDAAGNRSTTIGLSTRTLYLTTSTTGAVGGVVYDVAGSPLAYARVVVTMASGATKSVTTGSGGAWKISYLAPGSYSTSVSLTGYVPQTVVMTAGAGKTTLTATALVRT